MTAAEASGIPGSGDQGGGAARLRVMCSHGGRFLTCGPGGAFRYVGGETRVLVVPRDVSFRELAAKLGEVASGGKIVSAVRYRLFDDEDVLVSVTCDEELAHMRDEYDRLRATLPSASFRVFFSGVQRRAASGLPALAPKMRRVLSEQALARMHQHAAGRGAGPAPMRRAQSAHELAGCSRFQPCCYDRRHQCYCSCHLRPDLYAPLPRPAPPMCPLPSASNNAQSARRAGQEPAPGVSAGKPATGRVIFTDAATSKNSHDARPGKEPSPALDRRAFWEFE